MKILAEQPYLISRELQNFAATVTDAQLGPTGLEHEDGSKTKVGRFLQVELRVSRLFPADYLSKLSSLCVNVFLDSSGDQPVQDLDSALTAIFTLELMVNMFAHWFTQVPNCSHHTTLYHTTLYPPVP